MGDMRQLNRQLQKGQQQMLLLDTKATFNGFKIVLMAPAMSPPALKAKQMNMQAAFNEMMGNAFSRASIPNMHDIVEAHLIMMRNMEQSKKDIITDG